MLLVCQITKATIQTYFRNISFLLLYNRLIPSHLVQCRMAKRNKTEKLRSDFSVIVVCYHNCTSKEAMSKRTFCFNAETAILRKIYVVLLLAT